jgi:hypothetical protein
VGLGVDHVVAGNPMRFERGEIALRRDDRWRVEMPVRSRIAVGGLTAPVRAVLR